MRKNERSETASSDLFLIDGEQIVCKVKGEDTFGRFAIVEKVSPPKYEGPKYLHNETDNIVYVLKGKYELEIGEEVYEAEQGDVVIIPRKTSYRFDNLLDEPSRMLAIITPSGVENFFAEASKLKQTDKSKIVNLRKLNDLELTL